MAYVNQFAPVDGLSPCIKIHEHITAKELTETTGIVDSNGFVLETGLKGDFLLCSGNGELSIVPSGIFKRKFAFVVKE